MTRLGVKGYVTLTKFTLYHLLYYVFVVRIYEVFFMVSMVRKEVKRISRGKEVTNKLVKICTDLINS